MSHHRKIFPVITVAANTKLIESLAYLELTLPADAPFELRPTPGKGWGAFATRDIAPDTKVLDEAALFRVKGSIQDISLDDIELEATRLSTDQRAQIDLLRIDGDIDERFPNIGAALNRNLFSATKDDGRGVGLGRMQRTPCRTLCPTSRGAGLRKSTGCHSHADSSTSV